MNKGVVRTSLRATSPSPPDRKELGLAIDPSELTPAFSPASGSGKNKTQDEMEGGEGGEGQVLWPVPVDTSVRIGDPTNIEGLVADQASTDTTRARLITNVDNFFGLMPPRTTATHLRGPQQAPNQSQSQKYTPHAPFRFAVEFWGLDTLKEKVRLHSHTVWYAGSLWNVYTQAVRKKGGTGVQVGVYLHRQSSVDPLPGVSTYRPAQAVPTSTIVTPIPIALSLLQSMPPSTDATGRGRAQSEGAARLRGSRSAIWRATTPVSMAPRLSSPSSVSVIGHPASPITSPSSISVVATANMSGSSGMSQILKKTRKGE